MLDADEGAVRAGSGSQVGAAAWSASTGASIAGDGRVIEGDVVEQPDWKGPLSEALERALGYLEGLPERPVGGQARRSELHAGLGGPLPEAPGDPREVIAALATAAEPGLLASPSGRFFGFVVGGTMPAALAADWLTSSWDQNAGLFVLGPAASVVEEVVGGWLVELLGLPADVSYGFVTGVQMANFTGLAAARNEVLRRAGWDVEASGLVGAPPVRVLAGEGRHDTIDRAARYLGLGRDAIMPVAADDQGRMRPEALRQALAGVAGPVIVCAQAGNVNSGAVDPVGAICEVGHQAGAWVHVDGAFGLWAAASPRLRHLVAGVELADSWATDAHKWLNVPYDSGLVFCAHPQAHQAAVGVRASYLMHASGGERDEVDYTPDFSRRARGFPVYAALRALGRSGVAELVERCCALASRFAERLAAADGVEVLNEVVLNQVLVRFADSDSHTREVVDRVQQDGTCWMSGTTWRGRAAMRISVSNWSTDEADVDRSVAAILRCAAER
jgi:glutamate/tyrosine decarboxylase-like PLP-dependent enzyme